MKYWQPNRLPFFQYNLTEPIVCTFSFRKTVAKTSTSILESKPELFMSDWDPNSPFGIKISAICKSFIVILCSLGITYCQRKLYSTTWYIRWFVYWGCVVLPPKSICSVAVKARKRLQIDPFLLTLRTLSHMLSLLGV